MTQFLAISKHAANDCPIFNETTKKLTLNALDHLPELAKKHNVKLVGSWTNTPEHTNYWVFDAPTATDLMELNSEPEISKLESYSTMEIKPVETYEETLKQLR